MSAMPHPLTSLAAPAPLRDLQLKGHHESH